METTVFLVKGTFTLSWTATAASGSKCSDVGVSVDVDPAVSNVNSVMPSGEYLQFGCQLHDTQVSGVSGRQFLYITAPFGTAHVRISGPITP